MFPLASAAWTRAAHPKGSLIAVGSDIQYRDLRQRIFVVAHQPARIWPNIAMRSPTRVDHAVQQKQARPVHLLSGVEDHVSPGTVVAGSRIGRLNLFRTTEFLGATGHVQCMQPLMIVSASILRHGDEVYRSVRAGLGVNHRRGSHSNLRSHLIAAVIIAGSFPRGQRGNLPKLPAGVGIETVDIAVLGCDKKNIVGRARNAQAGQVERLGVDFAVGGNDEQHAKTSRVHIRGRERGLAQVLSCSGVIVVIRRDTGGRRRRRRRIADPSPERRIAGATDQIQSDPNQQKNCPCGLAVRCTHMLERWLRA